MYASYNMWVGGIYGKKQNVNNVYLLKDEIMNDLIFFFDKIILNMLNFPHGCRFMFWGVLKDS